jgi:hypothetical protein
VWHSQGPAEYHKLRHSRSGIMVRTDQGVRLLARLILIKGDQRGHSDS